MCKNNADKIKIFIYSAVENELYAKIPKNIITNKQKIDLNIVNVTKQQTV